MSIQPVYLIALALSDMTPQVRLVLNHHRGRSQDTHEGYLIYCDDAKEQGRILRQFQKAERSDILDALYQPCRDQERREAARQQMHRDYESRKAEYEMAAAPIRAERLRRKAENFAKRQPKKGGR